jgi:hypothetical protein
MAIFGKLSDNKLHLWVNSYIDIGKLESRRLGGVLPPSLALPYMAFGMMMDAR